MSQPESLKSRIIDVGWSPPAARSNGHRTVTQPISPLTTIMTPAIRTEASRPQPEPPREVITTLALSSPVMVIEDVQLVAPLDPRLIVLREPASARARSFRLLQHRLLAEHDPRIIAVTSALPGEGKTTCAANLALVLAETSFARVLLLDANLKRPAVADTFGFEPVDNLMTKLLRNEDASPPYAVASTSTTRLQLAALRPDVAAGKRLDRSIFGTLLHALRDAYDYIVIDTPAVLESADANIASQAADAVVMSTRAGKSRRDRLAHAIDQLRPANVLGAVMLDT